MSDLPDIGDSIDADMPTTLRVICNGGPTALLQTAVFSSKKQLLDGIGFLGHGKMPSTADDPNATALWKFNRLDAAGGFVKWQLAISRGELPTYVLIMELIQEDRVVWRRTIRDAVPDGPFPQFRTVSVDFR